MVNLKRSHLDLKLGWIGIITTVVLLILKLMKVLD